LLLEKIKMKSYISAQPLKMQLAAHLLQNPAQPAKSAQPASAFSFFSQLSR
jgi:hypothetical protein